ncbi:MAG: hypothetical protein Q9227_007084 [Pyrenula ochraceoflavens]
MDSEPGNRPDFLGIPAELRFMITDKLSQADLLHFALASSLYLDSILPLLYRKVRLLRAQDRLRYDDSRRPVPERDGFRFTQELKLINWIGEQPDEVSRSWLNVSQYIGRNDCQSRISGRKVYDETGRPKDYQMYQCLVEGLNTFMQINIITISCGTLKALRFVLLHTVCRRFR